MTKITTKELVRQLRLGEYYIKCFPKERSKLTYALQKLALKYKKVLENYSKDRAEAMEAAQVEYCSKDKDGNFLETHHEVGGQVIFRKRYTKENEARYKAAVDEAYKLIDGATVDFEPHLVPVPDAIDITWVQELTGFVFKEMTPEEEEKWYMSQKEKEDKKE